MHLVEVVSLIFYFIVPTRSMHLNCSYELEPVDGYNCRVKDGVINKINQKVTSVDGKHDPKLDNRDVKTFYVHTEDGFEYLPIGLNSFFPNLSKLNVERTRLKLIHKSDFIGLEGIKKIHFNDNQIQNFPGDTFSTLVQLDYISLKNNSIEILASNTFENLKNLVKIYFQDNNIQVLDSLLFRNNDKLKLISFNRNKLVNIGMDLIRQSYQIKAIEMLKNPCIDNEFKSRDDILGLFNEVVVSKCQVPMVMLTNESHDKIIMDNKNCKTKLDELENNFAAHNQSSLEKLVENKDNSIVSRIEIIAYFFKTVFDYKAVVYISVSINIILLILIIIRCSTKQQKITQIMDTTLILQHKKRSSSIMSQMND